MSEGNETKIEGPVAGPSRVGKPSASATREADAPDHFREPGNVTAGTVRDNQVSN